MSTIFIPYGEYTRLKRPKKCLVFHKGKGKMYVATAERYPENSKNKREFSIIIEKMVSIQQKSLVELGKNLDMKIGKSE